MNHTVDKSLTKTKADIVTALPIYTAFYINTHGLPLGFLDLVTNPLIRVRVYLIMQPIFSPPSIRNTTLRANHPTISSFSMHVIAPGIPTDLSLTICQMR